MGRGGGGDGGGGRGRVYTYRYTVTTRMTPALRWAAMRASKYTWCLTSTETTRLIKDGEKGRRGYGGGK